MRNWPILDGPQTVAIALVLFADFYVLQAKDANPAAALEVLYVVPIALLALRFGLRGGLVGALVGLALIVVWDLGAGEFDVTVLGNLGWAIAFLLLGTLLGSFVDHRRRLEAEISRYYDASIDLLATVDCRGRFTRFNAAWERVLGHPPERMRLRPYIEFVHPDDRQATVAEVIALTEGSHVMHSAVQRCLGPLIATVATVAIVCAALTPAATGALSGSATTLAPAPAIPIPHLASSPTSYNFPTQWIAPGPNSTQNLLIYNSNSSSGALGITAAALTGTNADQFKITNNTCVTTSNRCTIQITFVPTTTGTDAAALSLSDNLGDKSTVALTGTVTDAPTPPPPDTSANSQAIFTRVNQLRAEAGLQPISNNGLVGQAAANHSNYWNLNPAPAAGDILGYHQETAGTPGFTGVQMSDRCAAVGTTCDDEIMYISPPPIDAVNSWIATPAHGASLTLPGMLSGGADKIGVGPDVMDFQAPGSGALTAPVGYPNDTYSGDRGFDGEAPDPLQSCQDAAGGNSGFAYPVGAAITFRAPPVSQSDFSSDGFTINSFTVTDTSTGQLLNTCALGTSIEYGSNTAHGSNNSVVTGYIAQVLPQYALGMNTAYQVTVNWSVHGDANQTYIWQFHPTNADTGCYNTCPTNSSDPTLSTNAPHQNSPVSVTGGGWAGIPAPVLTYQWQRCDDYGNNCANIPGATNASYTPIVQDLRKTLNAMVTATNNSGSISAQTETSNVVRGPVAQITRFTAGLVPKGKKGQAKREKVFRASYTLSMKATVKLNVRQKITTHKKKKKKKKTKTIVTYKPVFHTSLRGKQGNNVYTTPRRLPKGTDCAQITATTQGGSISAQICFHV